MERKIKTQNYLNELKFLVMLNFAEVDNTHPFLRPSVLGQLCAYYS